MQNKIMLCQLDQNKISDHTKKVKSKIKKRISPEQNPVWFPLEHYTQGVKVDLFLMNTIEHHHN